MIFIQVGSKLNSCIKVGCAVYANKVFDHILQLTKKLLGKQYEQICPVTRTNS